MISETNIDAALSAAIQAAGRFLEKSQWPGGFWIDFQLSAGASSQWVTAYVAHCLAAAIPTAPAPAAARAWLLRTELAEGGWGYNRDTPPDADSTANLLYLLAGPAEAPGDAEICARVAGNLLAYQSPASGGFVTYLPRVGRAGKSDSAFIYPGSGWCAAHVSVTALAGLALNAAGAFETRLQAAVRFVRQAQRPQGEWEDYWWYDSLYPTCWAARFLQSCGDFAAVERAIAWLLRQRQGRAWGNGRGGPPSAFHTALAAQTLLLGKPGAEIQAALVFAIDWLLDTQRPDGSWEAVPSLINPAPEILDPRTSNHVSCLSPVADQNRQFTSATVIAALAAFRAQVLVQTA